MPRPNRKKILFVITKSNWGGAQAYVYTLATHFHTQGYDVAVALGGTGLQNAGRGELAEKLEAVGIRTIFVRSFMRDVSLTKEFRTFTELKAIIRSEKPDVVHLNSSKAGGIGALVARLTQVPNIIFTSHGLAYDEDRPTLIRGLIKIMTWFTFLLAHKVIVISNDNAMRARALPFCRQKIHLIYNGIGPTEGMPRDQARAQLAPQAISTSLWVGTIAELTRNKGLSYLIKAAGLLKKQGRSFALVIIGRGEDRATLEDLARDEEVADRVHFAGFVPQAPKYLSAFDIFVLPSVKEGLPYVLLEAAQASCAVVGSNIPGVTDIIDKSTGILFEPKNERALAKALDTLIADTELRSTLGGALHEKVVHEFSLQNMFGAIENLYAH